MRVSLRKPSAIAMAGSCQPETPTAKEHKTPTTAGHIK